jgi:hypothetical protein
MGMRFHFRTLLFMVGSNGELVLHIEEGEQGNFRLPPDLNNSVTTLLGSNGYPDGIRTSKPAG